MRKLDSLRIDRTSLKIVSKHADSGVDDWRDKQPLERLEGLEILRQMWSDYDPDTARLPRIYTVVKRPRG